MNLVAGDVDNGVFTAPGVRLSGFGALNQRGVVLGARAEDLSVVALEQAQVQGEVFAFELTGDATLLTLQIDPAGQATTRITAKAGKDYRAVTGQKLGFQADAARCFLFDASTQARIRVTA